MRTTFFLVALFLSSAVSAQRGIPSTVKLRVTDDAGAPVCQASVDGCFLEDSRAGARDRFNGFTDTNGCISAQGSTLIGIYAHVTREGYYSSIAKQAIEYKRERDGGGFERPERWDVEMSVMLRPIKNPHPMFIKGVDNVKLRKLNHDETNRYVLNNVVGYDLRMGEIASPLGKGKTEDFWLTWKMTIHETNAVGRALQFETLCEIRMTNSVDGICLGTPYGAENGQIGSEYISDYDAPAAGYTNCISFFRCVRTTMRESNDNQHYLYYFRIRTQTNELGQVTNAFYGKIHGQINGNFTYYLNPTPNDRNVEHDPKRNLFRQE